MPVSVVVRCSSYVVTCFNVILRYSNLLGVGTILKQKGCNGIANERLQVLIDTAVGHAHPAYNEQA